MSCRVSKRFGIGQESPVDFSPERNAWEKPAQKSVTVELAHLTYMLPPFFWNQKDNSPSLGTERRLQDRTDEKVIH